MFIKNYKFRFRSLLYTSLGFQRALSRSVPFAASTFGKRCACVPELYKRYSWAPTIWFRPLYSLSGSLSGLVGNCVPSSPSVRCAFERRNRRMSSASRRTCRNMYEENRFLYIAMFVFFGQQKLWSCSCCLERVARPHSCASREFLCNSPVIYRRNEDEPFCHFSELVGHRQPLLSNT